MRNLEDLRSALRALPESAAITLPCGELLQLLGAGEAPSSPAPTDHPATEVDFTVQQVAALFDKSPNTVRRWLEGGHLEGYKLFGRQWRITRGMLTAFQETQRKGPTHRLSTRGTKALDAWRQVV